jgi:hypothetical protein
VLKGTVEKAENARAGLESRKNEMSEFLEKYRAAGKLWKDIVLILILIGLIIGNVYALKWWGVL